MLLKDCQEKHRDKQKGEKMTASADQESSLDLNQRQQTSDNQESQTIDSSTQTTAKIIERYTLTHMPTCVHFTEPNSQKQRTIPRIHVPMCDCLLKVMLGYDMSERDEERVQAFEDCCVTVSVIDQNKAVSMPLKDLRKLLDTQEWTRIQRANEEGTEKSNTNGVRDGRLETGTRSAQTFGQTPISRSISDRQPGPTDTAKCSTAEPHIRDQLEVMEISDEKSDNALVRHSSQHKRSEDGGAIGKVVKEGATIGKLDTRTQDFLPGPTCSSAQGLDSFPMGTLSQCLTCQRSLNTTAELTEHFSGPCGTHGCAKSTEPPLHRKELHEDTIAPVSFPVIADETKVFFCDVCGKKFARKADLIRHTRSHSGERPYPCEFPGCGQQFIDTTKLRVHERIRHSVLTSAQAEPEKLGGPSAASDVYRNCPCCSTTRDPTPELLKLHLSIHRVHEGLTCRFCGKKFDKSGELLRHVTIHTGEKPFTCQFCPARLSDITKLKNHVLLWHKHEVIPERECDGLEIPKDVTKSDKELPIIETLNSAISDREMISVGTDDGQGVSSASSSRAENEVVAAHSISAALTATSTNQIVALSSLGPCRVSSSRTVSVLDESFIQVLGKVGLALFKNTTDTSHTASTLKTPAMLQYVDDSSYAQCVTQRKQAPGRSSIQELGSVPDQTQAIVAQHGRPCTVTKPRKADATQVEEIVTLPGQSSAIPGQGFVTQIEEILNQVQKNVTQREQSNVSQQKQSSLKHVVQTVDSWKARKPMSSGQMVATPLEEVTSASQLKRQGADVAQPEPIVAPYSPACIGQLDQVMDQAQELQRQEKLNLRSVDTGSVDAADCLEKSAERESPKPEESLQHRAILWKQASASHASVIVPSGITPTHSFKNLSSAATSVAPIQLSGRDGNTVLAEERSPQHHMHYATLPHAKHVLGTCTATHPVHMTVTSSRVPPIFPNYALPPAGHAAALTSGSTESVFMYERLPTGAVRYLPPPLKPLRYLLPKGHSYPSLSTVSGSMQPEVPDLHLKSTQTSRLCFCGAPGYMPTTQSFPAYFTQQHSQGLDSLSGGAQPQPPLVNLPTGIQSQGTILSPSVPQQHLPSGPLLAQRHSQRTVSFPTGIMSTFVLTGTEAQGKILHQPFTSGPLLAGTQTQVSTLHLSQPKQQIMVGPSLAGLQNQGPNELQQRPHAGLLLGGTQAQGSTLHLSQPKQQFTSGLQNQESNELQQQPHAGPLLAGTQAPRTMITLTEHEQRPTSGPVIGTTRVQGNKIRPTSGTVVTARQLQETTTRPSILHRTPKVVHARGSFCGHPDSRDRGSKHLHSCPRNKPPVCFPIGAHHQMGVCRSTRTPVHRHDITSHYSSPHARSLVRLPTQTSHPAACHTPTDLRRRQLNGRAAHSAVHPPWSKQTHDPITCTSAKGLRHENSLNGRDRLEFQDTKCSLVTSQAYTPGTSLASWSASPSLNPRLDLATETCQSSRQLPCDVARDRHVDITCVKRECEQDFHAQHVLISALKNGKTSRKRKASGKAGNFQKRVRFAL